MAASSDSEVAVVDCGSKTTPDIVAALEALGARVARVPLDAAGSLRGDAVIVSGGPRLFTSEPELIDRFAFLDALELPTLGICLGHQAIGMRHGARIHRGEERRAMEALEIVRAHPLLAGLGAAPLFRADHCEGIELPAGFQCLARSEHYHVEVMTHAERPLFGVQFHPEVSGAVGMQLLRNFLALARG
jgi:GMP synthase-like glutamine amidotransferase